MEKLLNDMLDPKKQSEAYNVLVTEIKTESGLNNLYLQLRNNNKIAYMFLKNVTSRAISENDTKILGMLLTNIRKYMELLYTIDECNLIQLLVFFETLTIQSYLTTDFFSYLQGLIIQHTNNYDILLRMLKVLNVTTKRYTIEKRSNALYAEINQNTKLFGELIYNFMNQGILLDELLEILYNFLYQDIPTFFEERAVEINSILNNLLLHHTERVVEKSCNVLTLFVLKYPECADTSIIMSNLCNLLSIKKKTEITELEKHLFCSIIRKKEYGILAGKVEQIIPILYKMCFFEFDCESLEYYRKSKSIEKDAYRCNIAETIIIIDKLFNPDYFIFNFNHDEAFIFFCTVVGTKQESIVRQIYQTELLDEYLLTAVVRYFLIHKKDAKNIECLLTAISTYNFAFFYITSYLSFLSKREINRLCDQTLITTVINYDKTSDDEVRSDFLYQAMRDLKLSRMGVPNDILEYLHSLFANYQLFTVHESYFKIFDCLALCITENKLCQETYMTIMRIFQTQNEEFYALSIQLLALLVRYNLYTVEVQNIFSTELFWMKKELLVPMSLLGISLYKHKCIDRKILQNLCEFLISKDEFTAYLILENLDFDSAEEYFTFIMFIASKKISYDGLLIILSKISLNDSRYHLAVNKCLDELLKSVAGKKNLNRLKKACILLKGKSDNQTNNKIDALLTRNEQREGQFENILHTVISIFEL